MPSQWIAAAGAVLSAGAEAWHAAAHLRLDTRACSPPAGARGRNPIGRPYGGPIVKLALLVTWYTLFVLLMTLIR